MKITVENGWDRRATFHRSDGTTAPVFMAGVINAAVQAENHRRGSYKSDRVKAHAYIARAHNSTYEEPRVSRRERNDGELS